MTTQEFDNTGFGKGMKALFKNELYWIRSVNFEERLLGLLPPFFTIEDASEADESEIEWVRCESCEIAK